MLNFINENTLSETKVSKSLYFYNEFYISC